MVQGAAKKYVDNLVNIYSQKKSVPRPSFPFGGDLEKSFLEAFEHTETTDQTRVWLELCRDLEGDFPMSRLLCGDVGFGKTELALRAAFRVVVNGGKVIVLCPTSVLTNQHLIGDSLELVELEKKIKSDSLLLVEYNNQLDNLK